MDDKINEEKNQPLVGNESQSSGPIFRTEVENEPKEEKEPVNEMTPEIVPEETPEEFSGVSQNTGEPPPIYEQSSPNFFVIGAAVAVFLLIFFLIIRLIFGGRTSAKKIELNYWGLWEDKQTIQPLIEDYQQKNKNVTINYQKMDPQDYRQKLITQINDDRGPDIFRFHNTWLPQIKQIIAALPDAVISKSEYEKTFLPVFQKDLKASDRYYGIPLYIDGLVLIYNKSLFDKAGVSIAPTNWEELIDTAARLTVKDSQGNILTAAIALGTAGNIDHFSDILGLFLLQNGADIKNLSKKEAVDALRAYREFAEPPHNFWDETMPNSMTAFIQEKVAMIIAPSWQILVIKAANPDLKIKVIPVPSVPGAQSISLANYWVEGVSIRSKNQIEAWKFLKFLSEKESLAKLYENKTKVRPFGTVYSRVDMINLLAQNEYLGAVVKQANNFQSLPLVSRTFDNGLNDEIIKYLENAINSTINGVSYEEAFNTARKGIDQVIGKFYQ
jgi:ABC-type glycerol-3-phosphate transport system substrate-binding protein